MFNKSRTEKQLLYSEIERLKKINSKLADENRRLRIIQVRQNNIEANMKNLVMNYRKCIEIVNNIGKHYRTELEK